MQMSLTLAGAKHEHESKYHKGKVSTLNSYDLL